MNNSSIGTRKFRRPWRRRGSNLLPGAPPPSGAGPLVTGAIASPRSSNPDHPSESPLMHCLREMVEGTLPAGASLLVLSDGDEEFLSLEGREVWPFPQTDDRAYAGHDLLADTPAALNQLATLRARGASFLVVPAPALWLLDRYREFK